jgi:hypothetical protein
METTERPVGPDGKPKKRFELKTNGVQKAVFVDGELFDWDVDHASVAEAMRMGPEYFMAAKKDIQKHFLDSLSEMVGRQLTVKDVAIATKQGWI